MPLVDGPEKILSAPSDSRTDGANLVRASLASAEEMEEEADEDGTSLVPTLVSLARQPGVHGATDSFVPRLHRLSAYLSTGPPTL